MDFYCAQLKLIIEVDGDQHFSEEGKQYDEQRSRILEGFGLRTLRFTNSDVMQHLDAVCERIQSVAAGALKEGIEGQETSTLPGGIPPRPPY